MKIDINLSRIVSFVGSIFQRFHTTIFIVVIVMGLSYAVLSLSSLLSEAADTTNTTTNLPGQDNNDQTTLDRIEELHTSADAPSSIELPEGRINPFVE